MKHLRMLIIIGVVLAGLASPFGLILVVRTPDEEVEATAKTLPELIVLNESGTRKALFPREQAVKFSLDQAMSSMRHLLVGAAIALGWIGKLAFEAWGRDRLAAHAFLREQSLPVPESSVQSSQIADSGSDKAGKEELTAAFVITGMSQTQAETLASTLMVALNKAIGGRGRSTASSHTASPSHTQPSGDRLPTTSRFYLICAGFLFFWSMWSGLWGLNFFPHAATSATFSIYGHVGVFALMQVLYFTGGVMLFLSALTPLLLPRKDGSDLDSSRV